MAWAFASQKIPSQDPSKVNGDTLSIAAKFGWVCPTVLVLITWLVWRLMTRRAA